MRKLTHAISEIRFADDWSSLFCQCGEDIHAVDADDLNRSYQDHRVACGETRRHMGELVGNMGESEFYRRQKAVNTPKEGMYP